MTRIAALPFMRVVGLCVAVASMGICGVTGATGCSKPAPPGTSAEGIDTVMLAFLSQARSLHHEANLKEDAGDLAGARDAMARLLAAPRPSGAEIDEVLADACARKAEIEVRLNDLVAAQESVERGLSFAKAPGYFRGHLLETSGLVDEALSKSLADAGKSREAEVARARALKALEEAIAMQATVIERALGADGGTKR